MSAPNPARKPAEAATVVPVALGARAYDIVIGRGAVDTLGARIKALRTTATAFILTDETVAAKHLGTVEQVLKAAGVETSHLAVAPGEGSKSYA
ncbi:MAG TPA: 3-dehydroquinate synthase, partial [Pseudolabrys sp.]|nr:3-dehydroquinate synthase [Pseudolabrys sp.]